ncbi:uncharacterized protein TNCV_656971 [Trichonephila clavipes]|nr:uncharacterized protein TNCV_656971 [Trichonephila clavipes]
MLNDEEIVTSVHEESDPVDDEMDEDEDNNNNESSKSSSNADTFSASKTAMEWYEQQSECCPTQPLLLKRMRDVAAKNKLLFSPIRCPVSYTAWMAFGFWLSERCPAPIDSDKRRSTVNDTNYFV